MRPIYNIRSLALLALLSGLFLFPACRVKSVYRRPDVAIPPAFRGAPDTAGASASSASLGDEKWWTVFGDPKLQDLIHRGLAQNFDQKIAAERVIQAQAVLGITQADQRPSAGATGSLTSQRLAKAEMGNNPDAVLLNFGRLGLGAVWNMDFWGKYRSATEAARARLLATEWAQRTVTGSLVASIATSYFQLRTLDMQLDIARKSLVEREESLALTRKLEAGGSATLLDVREAEQLVFLARAQITDLERLIEQQEDAICTLLGENPHDISRGLDVDHQPRPPEVPAGLTSALLERRPDIRSVEAALIAANAEINVARTAYFPQIALTGSAGDNTNALTRLFSGPSYVWNFGPSVSVPIFDAHRIANNIKVTESQQREAVLTYQKTIAEAFRDVSQSLVAWRKYREFRTQQEQVVSAAADSVRLARVRYEHGQSSYLEVLTNDRTYLQVQFDLATAKQNELLSLVRLYNALGGGWQQ